MYCQGYNYDQITQEWMGQKENRSYTPPRSSNTYSVKWTFSTGNNPLDTPNVRNRGGSKLPVAASSLILAATLGCFSKQVKEGFQLTLTGHGDREQCGTVTQEWKFNLLVPTYVPYDEFHQGLHGA